MAMMFGWYEMDLALGRVGYMPPLQGLGFLWGLLPRALPWAITLCPFGAEDRCGAGDEDRCDVGAREVHSAPSGLGGFTRPFTQGFALGYRIVPRWGGRPVRRWGV